MASNFYKKRLAEVSLGGPDAPLSRGSFFYQTEESSPICSTTYGQFSEEILSWIDMQEPPQWEFMDARYQFQILSLLTPAREPRQAKIKRKEKTKIVKRRRAVFDSHRDQLMLQMLHSGKAFICSHPYCGEMTNLTVDHIYPLSKGGSDELDNLQFLCQKHNSEKGSKFPHA